MNAEQLLAELLEGKELRNYGHGWLLARSWKPYNADSSVEVPEGSVIALKEAGDIAVVCRLFTCYAILSQKHRVL